MKPEVWRKLGIRDNDYDLITKALGREPNYVELGMFSVMWSEHCSYKHSRAVLKTFPTTGPRVLQGPGENAGVVDIGDGLAVCFKIESHNHPSAVEPYQGAATGVGGIVRDIFTMGARPIALLNSLRFGLLTDERVRYLFKEVVAGIAGYGNRLGIPTVGGEIYFDPCYLGNPLVNAMGVGILEADKLRRGKASGIGDLVILAGARTGRDGLGGATFASVELGEEAQAPETQAGDPFTEKLLLEACLELIENGDVEGIQDLGAAGLTCAVSEMSSRGGTGMDIELAKVPCREKDLTPYEIMLAESQERMLIVVKPEKEAKVHAVFKRWGLVSSTIGRVTEGGILKIQMNGEIVAEVPARALAEDAPVYHPESKEPAYLKTITDLPLGDIAEPADYNDVLRKLLASPTIASKEWAWRQFDYMARTSTLVGPGAADAAVVRIRGTKKALAMATDCNSRYAYLDPYEGGKIAVAEAARNLACCGAEPLAITDNLNFGSPEKPEIFWQFRQAVEGISEACRVLGTPVTGGNVSLYNETNGEAIYPTPIIGMVGLLEDATKCCTSSFKVADDLIVLLGDSYDELGGSEYLAQIHGRIQGKPPVLDLTKEKALHHLVRTAIGQGLIRSAHDLSEGGLAVALAECTFENQLGAVVEIENSDLRMDSLLFGETQSRVVLSLPSENLPALQALAEQENVPLHVIGHTGGKRIQITINGNQYVDQAVAELQAAWQEGISCQLP